ncbi:hypothetical protein GGR54DRAFT_136652 [Hypoxylon sp. NC1633]|nr:hypothetical protein GGR54DRAFT_136652 [Hypoxylon sp. NC1633]
MHPMDRARSRESQLQIPVSSKPPPYRPGDGPPLAPIRMVPEHDSDAFIVDKRVLPGTAANGEVQLQMFYVVGWPDLPAARVSILATKIHDYVSPRALEDFEYKALLERDEELERQEAERKRKWESAVKKKLTKSGNANHSQTTSSNPATSDQRRRGRPSKAELQARRLKQQAGFDKSQSIDVLLPSANTSGPSLSTPKKKSTVLVATDIEEDVDEADTNNAIYNQLYGDDGHANGKTNSYMDVDMDENDEDEDISLDDVPETMLSGPEMRSYARTLWINKDSTLFKSANGKLALKSSTTHVPVPNVLRSNKQFPAPPPKQINSQPTITPVPVPSPLKSNTIIPSMLRPKPKPIPTPIPSDSTTPTPKYSTTPVPVPTLPHITHTKRPTPTPKSTPTPTPTLKSTPTPILPPKPLQVIQQHHGFTPAGRSFGKWPTTAPAPPTSAERAKKLNPKPEKKQSQLWVVEKLEGVTTVMVESRVVRYFKVRWEGTWPPGQNPTWEPEDNIPPNLVAAYLKKKRKAVLRHHAASSPDNAHHGTLNSLSHSKTSAKAKPLPLAQSIYPPTLKRKYSSVAEAFAGDEGLLDGLSDRDCHNNSSNDGTGTVTKDKYENENEGLDEILVVAAENDGDEDEDNVIPAGRRRPRLRSKPKPKPSPEELGAAFMRDLAAAIQLR